MTWPTLLKLLKEITGTKNYNISDADFYSWLTLGQTRMIEKIKSLVDAKFFYKEFTGDLSAGEYKYNTNPVNVIDSLYVKYTQDGKYVKAREVDVQWMDDTIESLRDTQSESEPLYQIIEDRVHIYPKASTGVTGWLWIVGKNRWSAITAGTTDGQILNGKLVDYEELVAYASAMYVYQRTKDRRAYEAESTYQRKLQEMIAQISHRWSQAIETVLPNLTSFMK